MEGYKTINPKECEESLATNNALAQALATIRIGTDVISELALKVTKSSLVINDELSTHTYDMLKTWLQGFEAARLPDNGPVNLIELSHIPGPLHGDKVFKQFICPITHHPIRDPVMDPDRVTYYERSAIANWILFEEGQGKGPARSPKTSKPIKLSDLVEAPAVKLAIDARLEMHNSFLQKQR